MTYVKMKTEDWILQLRDKLYQLFDPDKELNIELCPHAQLIEDYLEWAKEHYDESVVSSPSGLADLYYNDAEAVSREEEDKYLMEDEKSRTEPMSDSEWRDYCKNKNAIIITDKCALITDGYCHREEKI